MWPHMGDRLQKTLFSSLYLIWGGLRKTWNRITSQKKSQIYLPITKRESIILFLQQLPILINKHLKTAFLVSRNLLIDLTQAENGLTSCTLYHTISLFFRPRFFILTKSSSVEDPCRMLSSRVRDAPFYLNFIVLKK